MKETTMILFFLAILAIACPTIMYLGYLNKLRKKQQLKDTFQPLNDPYIPKQEEITSIIDEKYFSFKESNSPILPTQYSTPSIFEGIPIIKTEDQPIQETPSPQAEIEDFGAGIELNSIPDCLCTSEVEELWTKPEAQLNTNWQEEHEASSEEASCSSDCDSCSDSSYDLGFNDSYDSDSYN